ncbi:NAD(P)/FAD-dependent oxidoreductase [Roseateles violae]|uniref:FAD-binding oxidoreductase n=1 Tax=Roseateles violae TaxID=3058042 RepID=A0ABT8E056_9BURK|nr:FAD-binding oxidoreductase [Pelomonas sp. PFR6]MDN3923202.1 FAD-binding oxidoreductase [Pelomonas sp. PFR6]
MTNTSDVIILGAGMAGASLAAELSTRCKVTLLELEDQPGRHATGRSAAMFFASYGNATIRGLTRASRSFLETPPEGFVDVPLMIHRPCLIVAGQQGLQQLDQLGSAPDTRHMRRLDADETLQQLPILNREWVAGSMLEEDCFDLEVAALHQSYLRVARRKGVAIVLGARETRLERKPGCWSVSSRAGVHEAPLLINAAGAWADEVARAAGVAPVGLVPKRRTAFMIPAPKGHDITHWPAVVDASEQFYFKPDAGQLLVSPANEDPMAPCDAAPDEMDIALAVDRFERATTLQVTKVTTPWAGLRSFVADKSPVLGFDAGADGFFWLAGQGGYGIQTAPAMARTAAALVLGEDIPADIRAQGVSREAFSPDRPGLARAAR